MTQIPYRYHTRAIPLFLYRPNDLNRQVIPPNFLVEELEIRREFMPLFSERVVPWELIQERRPKVLLLNRWGALGDLVMLVPVVRALQGALPFLEHLVVATAESFLSMFRHWPAIHAVAQTTALHYDLAVHFGGALDADVYYGDYWKQDRVDLYYNALGVPLEHRGYDYSIPTEETDDPAVKGLETGAPVVGIQLGGSVPEKNLPISHVVALAEMVSARGCRPLILTRQPPAQVNWPANALITVGLEFHKLVAVIRRCRAVISMDSGIQTLTHITGTPLVNLLALNPTGTRLAHHPLAVIVRLDKMAGCRPCGSRMYYCQGAIPCMRPDVTVLTETVRQALDWLELGNPEAAPPPGPHFESAPR